MDNETHMDAESGSGPTTDNAESFSYGGPIFSRSHRFTVAGGTFNNFNNVTNNVNYTDAPIVPSDFRMIPMGDIDLLEEIHLDNKIGIVGCPYPERTRVRRVYSAKINDRKSGVTVAMYQGDGAEEEWRQDIANYMTVRHPNIIQLHAAASVNNMHATIFHDDLIPFEQFLNHYSPLLKVYIYGYCSTDFIVAQAYFSSVLGWWLFQNACTFWIRRSSGRLCVDLIPANSAHLWDANGTDVSPLPGIKPSESPTQEATAIDALTLSDYHRICYWNLSRHRNLYCSASATVTLNAIIACASGDRLEDLVEIALLRDAEIVLGSWRTADHWTGVRGEVMEGGGTRFDSGDIFDITLKLNIWTWRGESWLSQANHIFSRLGIISKFENYTVVEDIYFQITIVPPPEDPPTGYLFLCPPDHFRTGSSSFGWPEYPAYWSLNPSGVEHLSVEDATSLGFPSISLSTQIYGRSWDAGVYAGLRQFHQAKGFGPETQDIARNLGKPLYQLSNEIDSPFAYIDDEDFYWEADDQDPLGMDKSDDRNGLFSKNDG